MSSSPGGAVSTQIPKQRVLLVDDSKIVRTTLARLIRKSFDVREEANGETGWQAIATDPSIVVVFSDIQMPVLDGFALLERIRQSEEPRIRSMPVIVISGDEDDATKKRARAAGANDFITKTTTARKSFRASTTSCIWSRRSSNWSSASRRSTKPSFATRSRGLSRRTISPPKAASTTPMRGGTA